MVEQGDGAPKTTDIAIVAKAQNLPAQGAPKQGFVELGAEKRATPVGGIHPLGEADTDARTFTPLALTDYIRSVEERGATVEHMARAKDDPWFKLKSEQWVEFRKKEIVNHPEVADMTHADFFTFGYFDSLDITWEDLEGKDVLDLGAGTAHFAYDCKQRGIDVVSVDNNPDYMGNYHLSHKDDVPYIIADGADTRLPDESFDLVVSHAGMVDSTKRQVRKWIAEADRVLKPGGEFRFTAWFKGGEPDFVSRNPNITSYIPFNPYTHGEFVADNTNVPVFIYKKPAAAS